MIGETRERFSRYFSFRGRMKFAAAIATCTKPAIHRSCKSPGMVFSFWARRLPRALPCGTLCGCAFPPRRDPTVSFAQNVHHSGNPRSPNQRSRPPDFARQLDGRIRTAVAPSVAQQELHFLHQLVVRQTEQFGHPRVLQRRQRHPSALHNRGQPARDPRAKLAVRVKEQPAARVPPFSVCVLTYEGNHFLLSASGLLREFISRPSDLPE